MQCQLRQANGSEADLTLEKVFYRGVLEYMGEIIAVLELGPSGAKTDLSLVLTVGAQAPLTTVTFQLPG